MAGKDYRDESMKKQSIECEELRDQSEDPGPDFEMPTHSTWPNCTERDGVDESRSVVGCVVTSKILEKLATYTGNNESIKIDDEHLVDERSFESTTRNVLRVACSLRKSQITGTKSPSIGCNSFDFKPP